MEILIGVLCVLVIILIVLSLRKQQTKQDEYLAKVIEGMDLRFNQQFNQMNERLIDQGNSFRQELTNSTNLNDNNLKVMNELLNSKLNLNNQQTYDNLQSLNNNLSKQVIALQKDVSDKLVTTSQHTNQNIIEVNEKLVQFNEAKANLDKLNQQVLVLNTALNDKKARGIFGEVQLYSLLENVYGTSDKYYHKQYKFSNNKVADALIIGPQALGNIVVDAKFPLENYNKMYDLSNEEAIRTKAKKAFKDDIKTKLKDIRDKYILVGETAEFALMFVPAEAVFSEIYNDDELIKLSYECQVYIVSPTTLMAYLTCIKQLYLNFERHEEAKKIQEHFRKLNEEFVRYQKRLEVLDSEADKLTKAIKDLSITGNKILKEFQKVDTLDLDN